MKQVDIFDGGHVIDMEQAMYWFLSQYKKTEKTRVYRIITGGKE